MTHSPLHDLLSKVLLINLMLLTSIKLKDALLDCFFSALSSGSITITAMKDKNENISVHLDKCQNCH